VKQTSGLVALAAMMLAACSSTTTTAVHGTSSSAAAPAPTTAPTTVQHAVAHGAEAPIGAVPWSEVGPGWTLAMWSPAAPTKAGAEPPAGDPPPTTLYLVNPEGGRYALTTFPARGDGGSPQLVDWSGDGSRALFYEGIDRDRKVVEVDLRTGTQTTFTVKDGYSTTPRYTLPEGKAVLLAKSNDVDGPPSLKRVDLAGNDQLTYPVEQFGRKFGPEFLSTPDGTRLVIGSETGGLAVMGNDGTGVKTLSVPGQGYCTPTRWWDKEATVTVADCHGPEFSTSRLWLVPIDGGTPTALTEPNNGQQGEVLGAETAWLLPEGTYVQALGACGYRFLAKRDDASRTLTKVSVPNVDDHKSVDVLGVYHGHLELQASLSCGDGEALLDYDPAAGTSTVLLGPTVNGGSIVHAMVYPGYK
jgi:TolB protein